MRRVVAAFLGACAGCYAPAPEAGGVCGAGDACPAGQVCDPTAGVCVAPEDAEPLELGAFGPARRIDELSKVGAHEQDPTWTADRLAIVFLSDRGGDWAMWSARRATPDDAWGDLRPLDELPYSDLRSPELSPDGLALLFGVGARSYRATRADRAARWGPAQLRDELGDMHADMALSGDGHTLVYERELADDTDLIARELIGGAWTDPAPLPGFATAGLDEGSPALDRRARRLVYARGPSWEEFDLYEAVRDSDGAFGPGAPRFTEPGRDADPCLTPDGHHLVFSRGVDDRDLYEADRSRPLAPASAR